MGDIIIAYDTVVREAQQQGKSLIDHTLHLVVHGVLHLAGYDHEEEEEALEMEALERQILQEMDIHLTHADIAAER